MNTQTTVSLDSLLDATLDDLNDLPEFKVLPPGTHRVTIKWDLAKKIGNNTYVELGLTVIETVELPAGSDEAPAVKGTESTTIFDLQNEFGQGKFKEIMKSLAEHYGAKSNRDLCLESQGAECLIVTDTRKNKEKTKTYLEVKTLVVV